MNIFKNYNFIQNKILLKKNKLKPGSIIDIYYKIIENNKEQIEKITGLIIKLNNKNLSTNITLYYIKDGIKIQQLFCLNSPLILKIFKRSKLKVKKSKLYFFIKKNIKINQYKYNQITPDWI